MKHACYIFNINPEGDTMNKELEHTMKALVAYSNTERFQDVWKTSYSIDYLAERSQLFLEIFNTFRTKMQGDSDYEVKELIRLLTKREFFISLVNKGIGNTIHSISEVLKLKEDITQTIPLTNFKIGAKEYEAFYEMAKSSYMESDNYHARRQHLGESYAQHGFYTHWNLVVEVFNKLFAQKYIQKLQLQTKDLENLPLSFKQTMTGEQYIKGETNPSKKRRI